MEKRIRVKDLAPFASIEDLSDEGESPTEKEKTVAVLSNIEEKIKQTKVIPRPTNLTSRKTYSGPLGKVNSNVTSKTPRIDISRASSASYQEDSSPERELILGKANAKLEVAFGEEIASELRKSTEELSFHGNEIAEINRWKNSSSQLTDMHRATRRKVSGCSGDLAFLSISGRTSRISSLGSVGSGCSGTSNVSAASHCSANSCISAASNTSRGSSPHRTSVETSFCGQKPMHSISIEDKYAEIMLQQTRPPSISFKSEISNNHSNNHLLAVKQLKSQAVRKSRSMPARKRPTIENPKTQKFVSLYSDEEDKSAAADSGCAKVGAPPTQTQIKARKTLPGIDPRTQVYIPLRGDSIEEKMPTTTRKKEITTSGKSNPFSFRRMKPFTNSILLNFISKYDASKDLPKETSPIPQQKIYEEFKKFISLRDDDDFSEGGGLRSTQRPKANPTMMPAQVHRSRSLSDSTAGASVKNTTELSKSDMRISDPVSPTLLTNPRQSSMCLSDSLLEQCHCNSSGANLRDQSHLALSNPSSSFSASSTIVPSHQSQFLQLDQRGNRPAKSMTQLSCRTELNSPNSSTTNICTSNNTVCDSTCNNYPLRRCSESAKEIQSVNKMKSRSNSFKSKFRTFFKKKGDLKTEKISNMDKKEKIKSMPLQIQKTQSSGAADSVVIIPLHSSDYNYEAAVDISNKLSLDADKKNGMTSKTVAVTNPSFKEETEPLELSPKLAFRKAIVRQILMPETNSAVETSLYTKEKIMPPSEKVEPPVVSIWVSFFFTRTTICNFLLYLLSIV